MHVLAHRESGAPALTTLLEQHLSRSPGLFWWMVNPITPQTNCYIFDDPLLADEFHSILCQRGQWAVQVQQVPRANLQILEEPQCHPNTHPRQRVA
jgi:hypothetical protein